MTFGSTSFCTSVQITWQVREHGRSLSWRLTVALLQRKLMKNTVVMSLLASLAFVACGQTPNPNGRVSIEPKRISPDNAAILRNSPQFQRGLALAQAMRLQNGNIAGHDVEGTLYTSDAGDYHWGALTPNETVLIGAETVNGAVSYSMVERIFPNGDRETIFLNSGFATLYTTSGAIYNYAVDLSTIEGINIAARGPQIPVRLQWNNAVMIDGSGGATPPARCTGQINAVLAASSEFADSYDDFNTARGVMGIAIGVGGAGGALGGPGGFVIGAVGGFVAGGWEVYQASQALNRKRRNLENANVGLRTCM
ncbi:MAG: hypothetical protein HC933_20500 [Pleurocapsa sp. SU_196_0]|nr:hypothetical protein [Pleurocapsa sp. SU_196_0]